MERFEEIRDRVKELADSGADMMEILSIVISMLKERFAHFDWVGIYLLQGKVLSLEAYMGKPTPHERINIKDGICGAAARERKTIVVDDVEKDTRYLTCSPSTRSEIVVPIIRDDEVLGEIDVDSDTLAAFDENDRKGLEMVAEKLAKVLKRDYKWEGETR